ncbi:MAG: hypothetical protein WA021_00470 [Minisyncoccia bacterium]
MIPERVPPQRPERLPETADKPERFDPNWELRKILLCPTKERPAALKIWKEKYRAQKEGLAHLQSSMIAAIRQNPDITTDELFKMVGEQGETFEMSANQYILAMRLVGLYVARRRQLREIRENYTDDRDLFAAITGQPPNGEITIETHPIQFHILCNTLHDFALLSKAHERKQQNVIFKDLYRVRSNLGQTIKQTHIEGLDGAVTSVNLSRAGRILGGFKANPERTRKHEEQHVLANFFQPLIDDYNFRASIEMREALKKSPSLLSREKVKRYVDPDYHAAARASTAIDKRESTSASHEVATRYLRELIKKLLDTLAQDEILAQFAGGRDKKYIQSVLDISLWGGGTYTFDTKVLNYIMEERTAQNRMSVTDRQYKRALNAAKSGTRKMYRSLVRDGVDALFELQRRGYSDSNIIGILLPEPLQRWKRVVELLEKSDSKTSETQNEI